MDACHEDDWDVVFDTLLVLSDAHLLKDIVKRRPVIERRAADRTGPGPENRHAETKVIVFGFSFTREGMQVWKLVGPLVVSLLDALLNMKAPSLAANMLPA